MRPPVIGSNTAARSWPTSPIPNIAQADATRFEKRLEQYQRFRAENPDYLSGIWWDEMGKLFGRMMKNGRIDLLDNHLGKDGLDITQFALPKKK